MSTNAVKLLVFAVLLVHGIGHLPGVASSIGIRLMSAASAGSWFLMDFGEGPKKALCMFFYLATSLSGILTALSFKNILLASSWWETLALLTAFFSTFCLIVFPDAMATTINKAGALLVDILIFYSILFSGNWPAAIFKN